MNKINPNSLWMRSYRENRGHWFDYSPRDLCTLVRSWMLVFLFKTLPKWSFFTFLGFSFFNSIVMSYVSGATFLAFGEQEDGTKFSLGLPLVSLSDWVFSVSIGIGYLMNMVYVLLICCGVVIGVGAGLWYVCWHLPSEKLREIRRNRPYVQPEPVDPDAPLSAWGVVREWIVSRHKKVCVMIEYETRDAS